jgi:UDP-3-O-[3-hydroxymyristoyl] N-acetylglucosamine deacetylase
MTVIPGGISVQQQTIAEPVSCTGIGLHSGKPVRLMLRPAPVDTGIVLVRSDRAGRVEIRAAAGAVRSTRRATVVGRGDATVGTVEHLLAALHGLGVDNLRAEVDGPELPVMDGSAAPFVYLLRSAGLRPQPGARRVLRILRRISVRHAGGTIDVQPARKFGVTYAVDFDHPAIGRQVLRLDGIDPARFERELCGARTFGFANEVDELRRQGLALGGSLDNTVVLGDDGVINGEGLRWPDEFVRHKVLDLMGDLAVLGMPLRGHVRVERGGHALHHRLVAAILDSPADWRIETPGLRGARRPRLVAPVPA